MARRAKDSAQPKTSARTMPSALPPKTLTLWGVAAYLGLGSPQAATRWLQAHRVLMFKDRLGYVRAYVRDIDAANARNAAEAIEGPRAAAG